MSTKLDEMNRAIDACPSAGRCTCIRLKCLVEPCPRRVAGHGYLVCDYHHEAYVMTGSHLFLVVWASFQQVPPPRSEWDAMVGKGDRAQK